MGLYTGFYSTHKMTTSRMILILTWINIHSAPLPTPVSMICPQAPMASQVNDIIFLVDKSANIGTTGFSAVCSANSFELCPDYAIPSGVARGGGQGGFAASMLLRAMPPDPLGIRPR